MLIGREAELDTLKSALAESATNRAKTVVIEGPVGSGKTELLEALAAGAAAAGAVVLRAAALRWEGDLPFGVLRQLVDSPSLPRESGRRLQALLDEDEATTDPGAAERLAPVRAARMQKFCAALHEVLRDRLVFIAIDDLQHVDNISLQYLLYIAGRSRSTRLMMVFTEALYYAQRDPAYRTEFLRQPNFQRIRLNCLDRAGTAEVLAAHHPPLASDDSAVTDIYAMTGGNPLLLRALLEDRLMAPAPSCQRELPEPVIATEAFSHAVLTCLDRSGPMAAKVVDGLVVLGEASTLDSLSRLCDLPRVAVAQGLRALEAAGVVQDWHFRHPAARAGVLEAMDPEYRRQLHHRAAILLYVDGAPAATLAPYLRAAECIDEPWTVSVLRDAAEEVLAEDHDRLAVEYLELAHRLCTDAQQCVEIRIRTAVILRRNNPSATEKIAEELLAELEAGRVAPQQYLAVADLFIMHRRIDEANAVIGALRKVTGERSPEPATPLSMIMETYYPWAQGRLITAEGKGDSTQILTPGSDPQGRQQLVPWNLGLATSENDVQAAAQELLQRSVLTDATLDHICTAVKCLMFSDRLEAARHWCETFLDETARRKAGGWYALFAGMRAEVAWREGNLEDVETYSRAGLDRIPEHKGSVLAGVLIGLQLMAQTTMGNYEAGARTLNHPASESLFGSAYGMVYLRARGHYHLSTNRLNIALEDFLTVGRLAHRWGVDQPTWAPWRGDVAEVLLRLGEREEAEKLLTEQLARTDGGCARIRGLSLRLLAGTAELSERTPLLTRAVAQLQASGDRLEMARALYDLGETHRVLGDTTQAAMAQRRAWQLAKECGAEPLCARMRLEHNDEIWDSMAQGATVDTREAKLSDSEKRVAVLAACGYSNRDISSRLYITVSTVEQHLTRVYRKLKIGGRQQLPIDLQFEMSEIV
ncbi:LuxR family transcriptional regulator [Streptomyces sp. MK37H]|uniref:helix-turn-helix transcriptional regulator n=1 Tax=Streptomyces sp. MK37H TaxID=2699117 RepID=UPI001B384782|nr:LuxR family transcriptional regulator [Streptomyces sp. MK37H]MBP8534582.1 AAA family ATPase [Streptomyces sp. MK37H]